MKPHWTRGCRFSRRHSVRELALGPYEIDSLGPGPTALRIPAKARGKRRAAKMPEGGGLADHMNPCSILQWWV